MNKKDTLQERTIIGKDYKTYKVTKNHLVQVANGDWYKISDLKGQIGEPNTIGIQLHPGAMTYICCSLITNIREVKNATDTEKGGRA